MDTVLFVLHIRGLKPQLVFYFRVEVKFAGGKFREIPFAEDIYFAGEQFRAKSEFANIAKISSTRKIRVIQYIKSYSGNGRPEGSVLAPSLFISKHSAKPHMRTSEKGIFQRWGERCVDGRALTNPPASVYFAYKQASSCHTKHIVCTVVPVMNGHPRDQAKVSVGGRSSQGRMGRRGTPNIIHIAIIHTTITTSDIPIEYTHCHNYVCYS